MIFNGKFLLLDRPIVSVVIKVMESNFKLLWDKIKILQETLFFSRVCEQTGDHRKSNQI